ncbi:vasoactive intestinal polypeptide receptor 2 [Chiloscyllium plagiosum]|uniref:vasoactive intestinal polypeptide receptor 2 n=1 Tax=Chiloscyllium plagiosum TaxID=36176 RepID=UPI001CB7C2DC|nr:vasoactive intestinal polypeptide receptor 2 [Chiloscyllium plagiosum]
MREILFKISFTFCSLFAVNGIHPNCRLYLEIQREELRCLTQLNKPNNTGLSKGCPGVWDNVTCWMPAEVGETVIMPCPRSLGFINKPANVSKNCTVEGWTDTFPAYTNACLYSTNEADKNVAFFVVVKAIYTLGHSISLVALTTGSAMLCFFRKLHCTRNYIHLNLFFSFILRAISVLLKDEILYSEHHQCTEAAQIACKTILVFFQYFVIANFYWLLVEGLYLHTLLMIFFSENKYFVLYILIGWGIPAIIAIVWTITRIYFEDIACWDMNIHSIPWWTLKGPILASIILNFLLFISIVRILMQKLKSPDIQGNNDSQYKRLAKSTLFLIPLLGIHYIVFAIFQDNVFNKYQIAFELCFGSFQGLIVSVLYCFLNSEVQVELKKKWRSLVSGCHLKPDYNKHRTSFSGNGYSRRCTRSQSFLQTETSLV